MTSFLSADLLLPQGVCWETWAVIACDQFTSEPDYWKQVRKLVGDRPSALNLILPEADLGSGEMRIHDINDMMYRYERNGVFREIKDSFIYLERRLSDGSLRRGLIGVIDLENYDYSSKSGAPIRATERTVTERIPPRVQIRENAPLELPHVMLLCDDEQNRILSHLPYRENELLYDFELMQGGGHVRGFQVSGGSADAVTKSLEAYETETRECYGSLTGLPMLYAVGDGNHSLAAAKACYEELKKRLGHEKASRHPARYALAELVNLHDPSLQFAPIHRIVSGTNPDRLLEAAHAEIEQPGGQPVSWISGDRSGILYLDRGKGELAVGVLQSFLDRYLSKNKGDIDYIHGDESLRALAERPQSVGFILPPMNKSAFFRGIMTDGVLPRKTFSMGQARDKRYYLEARRIRDQSDKITREIHPDIHR